MLENAACVARRGHAAGRTREDAARGEPDRVSDRRKTAVRLHDENRSGIARLRQTLFEAPEIALEDRSDIGIDHRRADPLEFLDLRKHLRREADICRRHVPGERLRRDTLVLRRAIGVQEAHGNRLDLRVGEGADGRVQRATVNRRPDATVGPDSLAHRQAQMAGYERLGSRLAQCIPVVLEPFPYLQHVTVPLGGEQADLRSLALEQRIGRDRGSVDDAIGGCEQRGTLDTQRVGKQLQPGEHAHRLVFGCGGGLRGGDSTAVVDGNEVGERSAHVHTDSVSAWGFTHVRRCSLDVSSRVDLHS